MVETAGFNQGVTMRVFALVLAGAAFGSVAILGAAGEPDERRDRDRKRERPPTLRQFVYQVEREVRRERLSGNGRVRKPVVHREEPATERLYYFDAAAPGHGAGRVGGRDADDITAARQAFRAVLDDGWFDHTYTVDAEPVFTREHYVLLESIGPDGEPRTGNETRFIIYCEARVKNRLTVGLVLPRDYSRRDEVPEWLRVRASGEVVGIGVQRWSIPRDQDPGNPSGLPVDDPEDEAPHASGPDVKLIYLLVDEIDVLRERRR